VTGWRRDEHRLRLNLPRAWPLLVLALGGQLKHLRRGPSFGTIATFAALAAPVWPVAAVLLSLAPRGERR
jgi:hypothetical protein